MTGEELLGVIIVWAVLAAIPAWIASSQGRSPVTWFAIGVLVSPLIAFVAVILTAPRRADPEPTATAPAPPATPARQGLTTLRRAGGDPCPQCGHPRDGTQRFCSGCGFDYWKAADPNSAAGTPPATTTKPEKRNLPLAPLLIIAGVVVGLLVIYTLLSSTADGIMDDVASDLGGADLPPAGTIWFGSSFDTNTFEVRGRTRSVRTGEAVSMVASLDEMVDGSDLTLRVYLDDQLVSSSDANADGSGDLWGWTLPPHFIGGTYRYEVADLGGNVLASGKLTVRE